MDCVNSCVEFDLNPLTLHGGPEGVCDRACAAHGKVHAVRSLQVVDQPVDTRRVKRISPHKERLDGKCLTELLATKMARDHLPNGLVIPKTDEAGNLAHHGQEGVEWLGGQLGKTDIVDPLRVGE